MCVIISLRPGVNVPFPMIQNATWNNPHGYGLIVHHKDGLEVTKKLNPAGTQPEEVDKILRDNDKFLRTIHLRWMTEGDIIESNLHPFRVYNKKGKEIWFMHNGTLYDYKPGKLTDGTDDPRSDSRIFADEVLTPFFAMTGGEYNSQIARDALSKFWGPATHNKGILVSNKSNPVLLNIKEWKNIKNGVDEQGEIVEFYASNDSYFDKLERGFEYDRREEVKKRKETERLTFRQDGDKEFDKDWPVTKLKDICFKPNEDITGELSRLMDDYDLWSDQGLASLENLTELEIHDAVRQHPKPMAQLMVYLTGSFGRLFDEYEELHEKHQKASKMIAELKAKYEPKKVEAA